MISKFNEGYKVYSTATDILKIKTKYKFVRSFFILNWCMTISNYFSFQKRPYVELKSTRDFNQPIRLLQN